MQSNPNERMYRTGDLARWTEDGNVEFLGRIDTQVKILGHRIEPGEIETVLTMHPGVKHVSVVAQTDENGTKRLVAYYASSSEAGPSPRELRQFLQGKLPQYMVPSLFVALESLPLSTNGKVDRSALPAPVFGCYGWRFCRVTDERDREDGLGTMARSAACRACRA